MTLLNQHFFELILMTDKTEAIHISLKALTPSPTETQSHPKTIDLPHV
jgi:hypothetical protein